MRILYTLGIAFYTWAIHLAALFNKQAGLWVIGRRNQELPTIHAKDKWLWVHAASLGEFEQGRPLIEKLKGNYPDYKILLTFFSPSGYEVRKNYPLADAVLYLPVDYTHRMKNFVKHFQPKVVVFVKYEYWYNLMRVLKQENIPFYYISAIYRNSQAFFKPWGTWFRKQLKWAEYIFCQDDNSLQFLSSIGIRNAEVVGDTRFDRVMEVALTPTDFPEVKYFCSDSKIIVAGSTWPEDEKVLSEILPLEHDEAKWILAPHVLDDSHLVQIEKRFAHLNPIRFSRLNRQSVASSALLLIDEMGLLAHLYQYAHLAYIGGGFGAGIHNTLEAAVYGIPVVFGPNFQKFREARQLIEKGGGFSFEGAESLGKIINDFLQDHEKHQKASIASREYVQSNLGATEKIATSLEKHLKEKNLKEI